MKKILTISVMSLMLMTLYGCKETYQYVYMHSQEDIESIDIVVAEEGSKTPIITVLKTINTDANDQFIEELNQIKFQKYLYDEHPTIYGKQAVMITYKNGDYEIITYDVQTVFFSVDKSSEDRRFYTTKDIFDDWLLPYMLSSES